MGKKNKKRSDSWDDDLAFEKPKEEIKETVQEVEEAPKKMSKKDKKKKSGGKAGGDDDHVDVMAALNKANADAEDGGEESDGDVSAQVPAQPKKDMKKGKKKKQKGRRGVDDSDDEDAAADLPTPAASTAVADAPLSRKDKKKEKKSQKGKRGGGNTNDSDDDAIDMMAKLALANAADESDDESADVAVTVAVPVSKKQKEKKGKKGKGKKVDDDSDGEDFLAKLSEENAALESDEEVDEEAQEDVEEEAPADRKKKSSKKDKSAKKKKEKEQPETVTVTEAVDEEDVMDEKAEQAPKFDEGTNNEDDGSDEDVAESVSKAKLSKADRKKQKSAHKAAVLEASTAPPAAEVAIEEVKPGKKVKEKKMSKLEKKMEAARVAKEELDREKEVAREEERARVEESARDEDASAAVVVEETEKKKEKKEKEKKKEKKEKRKSVVVDEGVDEEAMMKATMFGDEVAVEYTASTDMTIAEIEATGKKLSNKEKKKLLKAAEQKQRGLEYDEALMKASAEGAQFACSQTIIDPNDLQWANSLDVNIPSVSISAHNKELFVDTELHIAHGRRYGLVGPNGAGKSTLLKMISAGELKLPPRVDFLYVEQEVLADSTPAVDAVLKADKERWALIEEEKKLLAEIEAAGGGANDKLDTRLGEVYEQMSIIGASAAESSARRILFGLGFTVEMQARPTKYFSGGWRMRISLARALFIAPTLLMLDEPTNHLDLNAVIWLDDYLQKWKKTLLVVSHDQDFLNSVCQEIIHLEDKKLIVYRGNYDTFKEQEAIKMEKHQKAWVAQEKRIREMKSKGTSKQNAEKNVLKSKTREKGARSSKKAEAASASVASSADSKVELIKRPREYSVAFGFPEVFPISPPIMEVKDVTFRYDPSMPVLFKDVNFGIDMSSRVCIVGPNGSGKSTLVKLLTEEVKPTKGEVLKNPRLRVGIYNQHFVDRLPMDEDPVTFIRRKFNEETYQSARNILGRYGLEGHAHTIPIRDLSGGQKARVVFVELSLMAPHILVLDEPTNNLDIESIDALCDALNQFNGGVVLVTHDARLINSINARLWVVDDLDCEEWESGFEGYREHLLRQLEEQMSAIVAGSGERPNVFSVVYLLALMM